MERRNGHTYAESAIWGTVAAGGSVLVPGLLLGAALASTLALVVIFFGCAMSEANYRRGVYRVKPPPDEDAE